MMKSSESHKKTKNNRNLKTNANAMVKLMLTVSNLLSKLSARKKENMFPKMLNNDTCGMTRAAFQYLMFSHSL